MKLRYSKTSPYARKVRVVIHETGLAERVTFEEVDPWAADTDLGKDNPLCKVPTLVLDGGEVLYDSKLICEYLDSLHDGVPLFPPAGGQRWQALRHQVLGDGILDAAVLRRIETVMRPEELRWDWWAERQRTAMDRALDALSEEAVTLPGPVTIGHVALGCALGYLDFRYPDDDWREGRRALSDWFDTFSVRSSMRSTRPAG